MMYIFTADAADVLLCQLSPRLLGLAVIKGSPRWLILLSGSYPRAILELRGRCKHPVRAEWERVRGIRAQDA